MRRVFPPVTTATERAHRHPVPRGAPGHGQWTGDKIVLPTESSAVLGALGGIRELLDGGPSATPRTPRSAAALPPQPSAVG